MPGQGRNAGGVVDSAIAIGERLDAGGFAVLAGLAGDHIGPADDTPPIPLEDERGPLVDVAGQVDCWTRSSSQGLPFRQNRNPAANTLRNRPEITSRLGLTASRGNRFIHPGGVGVIARGACRPWNEAAAPKINLRPDGAGFRLPVPCPRGEAPLAMDRRPLRGKSDTKLTV